MLTVQLLQQRVVRGFGEVALLVQQSQQAEFLWTNIIIIVIISNSIIIAIALLLLGSTSVVPKLWGHEVGA